MKNLLEEVCKGDAETIFDSSGAVSIDQLRDNAWKLRKKVAQIEGCSVALLNFQGREFLEALMALDGYAESILLIPNSMDRITKEDLLIKANVNYRVNPGFEICQKVPASSKKNLFGTTKWLLATSGTTGIPKLIEHSLSTLTNTVKRDQSKGRNFHWGSFYEPSRFAGLQVVLQALFSGSKLTLTYLNSLEMQLSEMIKNGVNAISATPTMWRKVLMNSRSAELPLIQITLGGETADQAILNSLRAAFPLSRLTHIYASTEAGVGFAVNDGLAGFPLRWLSEYQGSVRMRTGCENHLLIKPDRLPEGDEVVSRLDQNGFLDTQDVVEVRGDRVFFCGRASGAINVGGNKVIPESIEQVIRQVPGVIDARVVPKTSSIVGQVAVAEVISGNSNQDDQNMLRRSIFAHCRANLERWQVPAMVHFVFELPVNAAGKLKRDV